MNWKIVKTFLGIILVSANVALSQVSQNVTLLDNWFQDTLISNTTKVRFSGCWGYEQHGLEYGIIGSTEGTHFFQITDNQFVQRDFVVGNFVSSAVYHREIKTYQNYAYLTSDEGTSKLQIVDLSFLPDSVHLVAEIEENFGRVHNLFIDEQNALLYACMVTPIVGGNPTNQIPMRVFSLADPTNPTLLYEGPNDIPQVHDCFVKDNIAYLNCGFDGLRVYNFTNPNAPLFIQTVSNYLDQGYNHQGWLTPDGTKYVFSDESPGLRLKLAKFSAANQLQVANYFGTNHENLSVPHNIMLDNDYAFVAYYNEGLRIYDIRTAPKEIAHYDTYPDETQFKMNGAWGVYSMLPSQRILVSDRHYGFFLFDFDREIFKVKPEGVLVYPTFVSSGESLTIQLENGLSQDLKVKIYGCNGKEISSQEASNQTYLTTSFEAESGVYFVKVSYIDYLGDEITETRKILVIN